MRTPWYKEAVNHAQWWYGLFVLGCMVLPGCQSCDKVEAELRAKDRELRHLRAEADSMAMHNQVLQQELFGLRHEAAGKAMPMSDGPRCAVREIVLGRLTGGYNEDDCPGDESLQVVVEPRDADGHAVKVPGTLHIDVAEIRTDGFKQPLCAWTITPDKLRTTWRSGLFSTGYSIVLPWRKWPSLPKVRVVVHFTTADGRTFEAEKDCTIRLTKQEYRRPCPVLDPMTPPDVLPMPRPAETEEPPLTPEKTGGQGPDLVRGQGQGSKITTWQAAKPTLAGAVQLERPTPIGLQRPAR